MSLEKPKGQEEQIKGQFRQASAGYLVRIAGIVDGTKTKEFVAALTYAQMAMSRKKLDEFQEQFGKFKTMHNEVAKERGDMFLSEKANALFTTGASWEELNKGK